MALVIKIGEIMADIKITDAQTIKVEEGDVLLMTVPPETHQQQIGAFRKSFTDKVKKMVGSNVIVVVAAAEPGTMSMDLVKSKDLKDIYERLGDLETEIFYGGKHG